MGQSLECVCIDCKQIYSIGYGSSALKESDRYKEFMKIHGEHNHIDVCTDHTLVRGKNLVNDHPYLPEDELTVLIENYTDYENIDFE